jgi:uncharacterized protein (TIGR02996 family)
MSDEAALLAAIRATPDEDTPRLAYADWLDEHATSDAQRARAEFIRVQIEHSNVYALRDRLAERYRKLEQREAEIRERYSKEWLAEFVGVSTGKCEFAKGFLYRLELNAKHCTRAPRPSWYREPLVEVVLTGDTRVVEQLCHKGWLDGVSALDLRPAAPTDADAIAEVLACASCAVCLSRLSLWDDGYSDRALRAVAGGALAELCELSCMGQFTPNGWETVLHAPSASRLKGLTIGHRAPWQTADGNRPGPALAQVLVEAPVHSQLEFLWLCGCGLTNDGLASLGSRGRFTRLEQLHIDDERPGAEALRALGVGNFPVLTELRLSHCELDDEVLVILTNSSLMSRLERFDLSMNRLTVASARAIATSGRTGKLKYLDLGFNAIGDAGVVALSVSPHFPVLEEMYLSGARLADAGAEAVLLALWAGHLKTLCLSYNNISDRKRDELTAQFGSILSIQGSVNR